MAGPSKNFTVIADGAIDADSPLDTTLMANLRDNDIHLEEWLGKNYTAAVDHDHDGVNSKKVTVTAPAAIGQTELKTATGSAFTSGSGNLTLPGGEYGFYPQVYLSTGSAGSWHVQIQSGANNITTPVTNVYIDATGATTAYVQQRYVTASPPYKIGNTNWGHFLFLLRDISTGEVVSAYEAEDPPWAYNGATWLPKDDKGRIEAVPHPFVDYRDKDPGADGLEICLVDLRRYNVKKWKEDNRKLGRVILQDLEGNIAPGKVRPFSDFGLADIPGFSDRVKIRTRV